MISEPSCINTIISHRDAESCIHYQPPFIATKLRKSHARQTLLGLAVLRTGLTTTT